MNLSPIILFVYNRPWHTKQTIKALQKNKLAKDSILFIFSDAAKSIKDKEQVQQIRDYIHNIKGFKKITIVEQINNCGLANSIIEGVTRIVNEFGRIIVLEDDLVTSPYFLTFMNEALEYYQNEDKVWHISGWNYPINTTGLNDVFIWRLMNCWGWATWSDKWAYFEKNTDKVIAEFSAKQIRYLNLDGCHNAWEQVLLNKSGKIDTWAIYWYISLVRNKGLCLSTTKTLVENIGLDGSGINCGDKDIYKVCIKNINSMNIKTSILENELAVNRIKIFLKNKKSVYRKFLTKLIKFKKSYFRAVKLLKNHYKYNIYNDLSEIKLINSQILVRYNRNHDFKHLKDAEFKIFSQWGEDGIIQYLINKLPIKNNIFIEFGVQNYEESNTRFLLINDNWSGLVIDGDSANIKSIKKSDIYWKHDLVIKNLFITKNNINKIIKNYINKNNFNEEIGLLSIDIDGNDYYIWEAIECISPVIVICEYNWIFGNKYNLTIPYEENFIRTKKHYTNLYFGASIQALNSLAKNKGYEYIGCTSAGNDAFFVKINYAKKYLKELITTPEITFSEQKAKESRDKNGNLTYIRGSDRLKAIDSMDVLNLETNKIVKLSSLKI